MKQLTPRLPGKNEAVNAALARLRAAQRAEAAALVETSTGANAPETPKPKHVAPPRRKDGTFEPKLTSEEAQKTLRDLGVYRTI